MPKLSKIDRPLLVTVIAIVLLGFFIFISASLGLLAGGEVKFSSIIFNQLFFGLILGSLVAFVVSKIKYTFWKKYSFWIFLFAVALTASVFIPKWGFSHGGATRWISLGPLSFQPAEFLKIAFIIYFAAWLSSVKTKVTDIKHGLIPLLILSGVVGVIMLLQPDTDTFVVMLTSILAMYFVAGAPWKHIGLIALIGIIGLGGIIALRPYVMDRFMTFLNPAANPLTSGYQIQQSLIAIGSGGIGGRGFGQSVQKFDFLPEPIGDSIFAVAAEEFGFIGGFLIIALFFFFALRGLKVASRVRDSFGRLLIVGIVVLVISQAFVNIGSMLGVLPLSGLPLLFVSHGGTALLTILFGIGILFNVSRYQSE